MDNKEFENKLEQIKTFKEVPISVDEKIQKAFEKIEENEKLEKELKKQRSKFNFSRVLSLAASFVMAIFLAGNGVAYAKGEPNIYSWVLEKIGIQKEYEEIKTNINQTIESDGIEIKLIDLGYDANSLIIGFEIKDNGGKFKYLNSVSEEFLREHGFNNKYEYIKTMYRSILFNEYYEIFTDNNETRVLGYTQDINDGQATIKFSDMIGKRFEAENIMEQISENSYILYKVIDISDVIETDEQITGINIYIDGIHSNQKFDNGVDTIDSNGDWYFKVENLTKVENEYTQHLIMIEEQIDEVLKINAIEIKNSKVFDIIRFDTDVTVVKDGYKIARDDVLYYSKLVDKENNVIGEVEDTSLSFCYRINNLDINKEYRLEIYKVFIGEDKDYNYDKYLEGNLEPIYMKKIMLSEKNKLSNIYKFDKEIVYGTNKFGEEFKVRRIIIENYNSSSIIKFQTDSSIAGYENLIRIVDENSEIKCEINCIAIDSSKFVNLLEKGRYFINIYEYIPDYTKYDPGYEEPVYSEEDLKLKATTEIELK